jgi:integrase/recombinase XerD
MARGGMRIGEVLKLTLDDIEDRKLLLREPKSGKEHEVVFIPQKLANRLHSYAIKVCDNPKDRIFPISYEAARMMVVKAVKWSAFISGRMTCAGMQPLLHQGLVCLLKSSAR